MSSPPDPFNGMPSFGQVAAKFVAAAFESCEVQGCNKKSLGFVCSQCSRFVCQGHYYLAPVAQIPPKVVCVRCILMQAHMDPVLEADYIEPGPSQPKVRVVGVK